MPFKIRRAEIIDYQEVIHLWKMVQLPLKPKGRDKRENIEKEMSRPDLAIFLVAVNEDSVIGTIIGTHDGRKGWINRLAVHPDYQHQGMARQLVREVENQLSKSGIDITACLIEGYNRDSMDFFKKIGYQKHEDIFYFSRRKYPYT
jgi:ribosomal protein S18 acetylase RimI-like enzyme